MDGFEKMMNNWFEKTKNTVNLSIDEKKQITKAGGQVFKDNLKEVTRDKHYSIHKDDAEGHMVDSIVLQTNNIDRDVDGTSIVGFDKYHATNARHLNDGTKTIHADHFVDETRANSADEVFKAEAQEYEKILAEKGKK